MTFEKFKECIIGNGNGVYFVLDGLKCGIEPEVYDSIFSFEIWYGHQLKNHTDFDLMVRDKFFGGKSILDLLETAEFYFF